jgi:hypothetical protein
MLATVTLSYRNRSQIQIIVDLTETVNIMHTSILYFITGHVE